MSAFCFFSTCQCVFPFSSPCQCMDNAAAAGVMHAMRMPCGCHAGVLHVMYTWNSEYGTWKGNGLEWNGTAFDVMSIPVFAKKTVLRDVGCTLVALSPCHPSVQCWCVAEGGLGLRKKQCFLQTVLSARPCNIELRGGKGAAQPTCTQHREALFFSQTPVCR